MRIVLLFCFLFSTVYAFSHQDTRIQLKKNGRLVGLPEKFSPARFDRSNLTLEIAENKIKLPDCVTKHFSDQGKLKFTFTASWYHAKGGLPKYLSLIVSSNTTQSAVQVLFNLETLEIFEINIIEENKSVDEIEYSIYYNKQEISENCKKEIFNAITNKSILLDSK